MAIAHIGQVSISYPVPEMNGGIKSPLISVAKSRDFEVDMKLEMREGEPAVVAYAHQRDVFQVGEEVLSAETLEALDRATQERIVVGLYQPHYATTYLAWIAEGLINPWGAMDSGQRKSA
ncbi:hypothetical protein [Halomonas sp. I5-271120]|uniref:hypothetical protein n=1 Tax=Halomonas sp. I5-271120 TaxID=3061632 RepID=UPI0027148C8F|nr:hypothetical protein [Halomonas sp. I5-271120]